MIEQTLHGLVVGLGKIRKDGSKEFRWLEKPIHNRIVSGGLDNYFMLNGDPNAIASTAATDGDSPNRFVTSDNYGNRNAVIEYIAIGTDGSATSFTDTGLKAQVGGFSKTIPYTTVPYFGTRLNSDYSTSFRLPKQSVTVSETTTVREVGWFGKYRSSNTYVMFSRVALPTPVELQAGESLTVVYQMNISYGTEEAETPSSLLSGLLDSDGNQLRGRSSYRLYFYSKPTVDTWYRSLPSAIWPGRVGTFIGVGLYQISSYDSAAIGSGCGLYDGGFHLSTPFGNYSVNPFSYTTDSTWVMKEQGEVLANINKLADSGNINSNTPKPYVPGTFYRDREVVVSPSWPSMTGEGYQDIYAICHNSYLIRFGHYDTTDPSNPVWVPKPWRKQFGQSYKFTFRYKLSTADTVE